MRLNLTDNFEIQRARNFEILFDRLPEYIPFESTVPDLHQRLFTCKKWCWSSPLLQYNLVILMSTTHLRL